MEHLPDVLTKLRIGSSVSYVANRGNTGDALIAAATAQVLEQMSIEIFANAPVVLVAGGGALHPAYECLVKAIAKIPRDRRVIILPSTVSAHWDLLRSFRNLTLLSREEMTHSLARMNGIRSILCHDAAFSFDYDFARELPRSGKLTAIRDDVERTIPVPAGNRKLSNEQGGWWPISSSMIAARKFVRTIGGFEELETNYLHAAIAGGNLGLDVIFRSNAYFKNRAVFESSLCRFPNVRFISGGQNAHLK